MKFYPEAAMERAMKVQEVILGAMGKRIPWWQAAEILGISARQMRRWKQRYEQWGYDGLYDRRRGKPSPRRATLAGCRVTVYEHLDGTLRMGYGPHQVGRYTAAGVPLEEKKSRPRRAVEKTVAAQPGKSLRDSHFPTAFIIRHTQTL